LHINLVKVFSFRPLPILKASRLKASEKNAEMLAQPIVVDNSIV